MSIEAIRFEGVAKRYPHFDLQEINFSVQEGSVCGFVGPNGAGKSTCLRILMGLVHQDAGRVMVLGNAMPQQHAAAKWDIGYISEDLRLYAQASLDWHMQFIESIYSTWDPIYAAHLLQQFDLKAEQKLKGLSHGQRVKAALLLVLARRPRLLVLDEPTAGLDPVARQEVLGELMRVMQDERRTILFSSHNTLDVEQISDQIMFIDRGRLIDSLDKDSFLERWRRLRIELPEGLDLPEVPGLVQMQRTGRMAVVTLDQDHEQTAQLYRSLGVTLRSMESLTLEEIFVANVQRSRGARHVQGELSR